MAKAKNFKGFTLIEILVVVALIAILTAITFIAINPAKNFADTRNAQRSSDVAQILNAITQYTSDQNTSLSSLETAVSGTVPVCPTYVEIGTAGFNLGLAAGPIVDEFIVGIPFDPSVGDAANTGYWLCEAGNGRIQVNAPNAENKTITVKR